MMYCVKRISLVSAAFGLTMLAACGDENTTEVTEHTGISMLEAGKSLPECDSESAGNMVYAADSAAVYYCADGKWQTLNGKDGAKGEKGDVGEKGDAGAKGDTGATGETGADGKTPEVKDGEGCTAKANEDGKSYTISCPGSEDFVVKNGKDGESAYELSGYKGSVAEWIASLKGDAGKNCAIEDAKDGEKVIGYKVTCGEDSKTILNGADGKDGVGCAADDQGDGKVVVTCGEGDSKTEVTLFKAVCGTESYEPAEAFCYEGEIYSCGNKPYDPAKQYCLTLKDEEGTEKTTVEELLIDNRDKNNVQVYKTVKICDDNNENCQTWMAQNLNYDPGDLSGLGTKAWSGCYSDEIANCDLYGRLYTWVVATNAAGCGERYCYNDSERAQGVCPSGWHLPSDDDWRKLFNNVGGTDFAGQKLKANTSLWTSFSGVTNDDSFGFAVLPVGYRQAANGKFFVNGQSGNFWSSTEKENSFVGDGAVRWSFSYDHDHVSSGLDDKGDAQSVRCVQD